MRRVFAFKGKRKEMLVSLARSQFGNLKCSYPQTLRFVNLVVLPARKSCQNAKRSTLLSIFVVVRPLTSTLSSCLEQSRSLYSTALEFIVLSSVFNLLQQLSELDRPPTLVSYLENVCGSDTTDLDLYQFFWNVTEAKSWILMTVAWF